MKEQPFDLTMTNSIAALAEFDADMPARDAQLEAVCTQSEFVAWERRENAATTKVRLAFYEDTKDRNSRDNCLIVGLDFVRRLCETAKQKQLVEATAENR